MKRKSAYSILVLSSLSVNAFASEVSWRDMRKDLLGLCAEKPNLCIDSSFRLNLIRKGCGGIASSCQKALSLPSGQTLESYFSRLFAQVSGKPSDSASASQAVPSPLVAEAVAQSKVASSDGAPATTTVLSEAVKPSVQGVSAQAGDAFSATVALCESATSSETTKLSGVSDQAAQVQGLLPQQGGKCDMNGLGQCVAPNIRVSDSGWAAVHMVKPVAAVAAVAAVLVYMYIYTSSVNVLDQNMSLFSVE